MITRRNKKKKVYLLPDNHEVNRAKRLTPFKKLMDGITELEGITNNDYRHLLENPEKATEEQVVMVHKITKVRKFELVTKYKLGHDKVSGLTLKGWAEIN